ncbi:MAG: histidine kinase [Dermatophilus congolensis]|nr:histidine kinase [Dermatophilus congolensis]
MHQRGEVVTEVEPVRRNRLALPITLGLLAASLVAAIVMALAGVPVVSDRDIPVYVVLTAVIAGFRVLAVRPGSEARAAALFWLNLALAGAAIWFSPAFGLYLFVGYYEAGRFAHPAQRAAGMIGTAVVISVAQVGGPRSMLFIPPIYLAFVVVNLAITGVMMMLDRQREHLLFELAEANAELRAEQERSARLRDQLVEQARDAGVAEERARLSREIHDTVAQDLVAVIAQLSAASDAPDAAEQTRRLAVADAAAREALAEARRAVKALASPRLDDTDLPLALDDLLGAWREATGLGGELSVTGRATASGHDDALLRVAQEALANVAKHARARRADVTLAFERAGDRRTAYDTGKAATSQAGATLADGRAARDLAAAEASSPAAAHAGTVQLTVRDDGTGFDTSAVGAGFGLPSMQARMAETGGSLDVVSSPDGTTVSARLPLPEEQA